MALARGPLEVSGSLYVASSPFHSSFVVQQGDPGAPGAQGPAGPKVRASRPESQRLSPPWGHRVKGLVPGVLRGEEKSLMVPDKGLALQPGLGSVFSRSV